MKRLLPLLLLLSSFGWGQSPVSGKQFDFAKSGATTPATPCSNSRVFFNTTSNRLLFCVNANWYEIGGAAQNVDVTHPGLTVPAGGINTANSVGYYGTTVAGNAVQQLIYVDANNNAHTSGNGFVPGAGMAYPLQAIASGAYPFSAGASGTIFEAADAVSRSLILPSAGQVGLMYIIKDSAGTAATHNITITVASAGTIDGAASLVISTNNGSARVYWSASGVYKTW